MIVAAIALVATSVWSARELARLPRTPSVTRRAPVGEMTPTFHHH